jgi:lysine/ornithine N-monooxygenase
LKYTNTPLLKLNNNFDPDIILTSSNFISKTFLQKKFKKKSIVNIGSIKFKVLNKNKSKSLKKLKYIKVLILPEGFDDEVKFLINFAIKTQNKELKIKYVLRLHPSINDRIYLNSIKKYIKKYNISLSRSSMENDIKNCDILFYRGSSSVIEASCKGLIPLYIEKQNELSFDVLYKIEKYKPKIKSIRDFYKFYNSYKNNYYKYNSKKTDKIIDYCRSYYSLIDKKTINKIINN